MVEPEKPLKKKDQIMFDKEVAQKLQAQEEKLARQRQEDENIAEWDNVQAMMDADYDLAARLQAEEQGELTIKEKSRLFVELMNKRKSILQDIKQKNREENHQLRLKREIQCSETRAEESSSKRADTELEQEVAKKQKIDDDQDEAEIKKHMEIVPDNEVSIDAIPLATKPPIIVDRKIIKEGKIGYF
ncbi:hypothetical protein Tco_0926429 [Tanacetum coccineum]|uniref:Uncharacterized protein n=1 Tax=Tanacetum coccineum TaxID=301880 RepID=A0ABQ5DAX1_9ASTR